MQTRSAGLPEAGRAHAGAGSGVPGGWRLDAGDPGFGLGLHNFRPIAVEGFGDRLNGYPHSMAWFQDHLYIGTSRANLALLHVGNQAAPGLIGNIVWPVKLPKQVWDLDLRAQIWRYAPESGEWRQVYVAPLVKGLSGCDVPLSVSFRVMAVFKGDSDPSPVLFVPTWATSERPETVMLRSIDGTSFDVVSEPGLGLSDPKPRALRGLVPFRGRLFTAPAMGQKRGSPNAAGRMVVLASSDPARGGWELACEPYFGDSNNLSVFQMAVFKGCLYAGTFNTVDGYQIWKTDGEGEPPFRWTKVVAHGAYRGKLNQLAMSLCAFGDHLYVGSAIQTGGIDRLNKIGPAPPELIRISEDDTWDLVVGEARLTPLGLKIPLSGFGSGFNNPFAGYFWQMGVHDGWLYLSNAVWSTFFMFTELRIRVEGEERVIDRKAFEAYLRKFGGFELWRTRDGCHWVPVTRNGFGNHYNIGARTMVSTPHGFFVGVANSFGPEVARRRLAGWTYEPNPRSGLEIWLGSCDYHAPSSPDLREGAADVRREPPSEMAGTRGRAKALVATWTRRFYADTDLQHLGYWQDDTPDAASACENLMSEILAFATSHEGPVLDLCCARGMMAQHLATRFPPESITGLTTEKDDLVRCRRNAAGVRFSLLRRPKLPFPDGSFQYVFCAHGLAAGGSRSDLIRETYRVLRPEGRLVVWDAVWADDIPKRRWRPFGESERPPQKPDDYSALLARTGFHNVSLVDATFESWTLFQRHVQRYFGQQLLENALDAETLKQIQSHLPGGGRAPMYCVIGAADRPARRTVKEE